MKRVEGIMCRIYMPYMEVMRWLCHWKEKNLRGIFLRNNLNYWKPGSHYMKMN